MKILRYILLALAGAIAFGLAGSCRADAVVSWTPSPDARVTGYKLFWGPSTNALTNSVSVSGSTQVVVSVSSPLVWFAAESVSTGTFISPRTALVCFTNRTYGPITPAGVIAYFTLTLTSAPNASLTVEHRTNVGGSWWKYTNTVADAAGLVKVLELKGTTIIFYRTVYPSY